MIRVLLVEDEPASADYLASVVRRELPEMELAGTCENGEEALALMRKSRVDIVITDIKMPVMDGLQLAEAVRGAFPLIPVVIISGYERFEYAKTALRFGVSDYLLKPVKPAEMRDCLRRLALKLEFSRSVRQALGEAGLTQDEETRLDTELCRAVRDTPCPAELRARLERLTEEYTARARAGEGDHAQADFEALTGYIGRKLGEKLTLEGVCRALGMSQTTVSRLFRTYARCSFVEYLTGLRVERAKALIEREPSRRMKEVACAAGFTDPLYFSRVFRAETGLTPTEFARNCQSNEETVKRD
jgi:YesN/AraC family two-component response regulator